MKAIIAILVLAAAGIASAQTAKVVQLSPTDASEVKSFYEQKAAIEKKLADLTEKIQHQYTSITVANFCLTANVYDMVTAPCDSHPEASKYPPVTRIKPGWENGFEFSEDFKFIVPKAYKPPVSCLTSPYIFGGGITPAYTINN